MRLRNADVYKFLNANHSALTQINRGISFVKLVPHLRLWSRSATASHPLPLYANAVIQSSNDSKQRLYHHIVNVQINNLSKKATNFQENVTLWPLQHQGWYSLVIFRSHKIIFILPLRTFNSLCSCSEQLEPWEWRSVESKSLSFVQ